MKQVGNFNKIPDCIKQPIALKKNEPVLYRLLDPVIDPADPKKERLVWKAMQKIPTRDTIVHPETGAPIDIGVVERVDRDGVPTIQTFWVRGMQNNGYFTLTGGQGHDDYYHWYFELCNYNESNPNRDVTVTPLFKRIDRLADAKKNLRKMDDELNALIYVRDMSAKDLKNLAAAMMWDENEDAEVLRDKARAFAKEDANKFGAVVRSKDVEIKAVLKRAQDASIINFSVQQNKVVWASNKETIATLPRVEGQDWLTGMCDWVKTSKNGDKTYDAIRKLLNAEPVTAQ